jgi:dTDP-4-dehydrorhamnose 3,5-epimerase
VRALATPLEGVLLLETAVHHDERGWMRELWREREYAGALGGAAFVQDNASSSTAGVLRGLHFQHPGGQGKLVSVLEGEVWDVAVDVRAGSGTFGRWTAATLSAGGGQQLWIPEGFAHGFVTLSERAVVQYRCTAPYRPEWQRTVRWDDPALGIRWPLARPLLSRRDLEAPLLADLPAAALPRVSAPRG